MTTVLELVDRIRADYLTQGRVEPRNRLAAGVNSSATSLSFTYDLGPLQAGAIVSVGLEDCYVWSTDATSKTAEVDRGYQSTVATAHSTGDRVRVAPRWTDAQIVRALNAELANLFAQGLYGIDATEVTYVSSTDGYNLPAAAVSVHKVMVQDYTGDNWYPLDAWRVEHSQNTTDFASGVALFVRGYSALDGQKLRVIYKRTFGTLAAYTDDATTTAFLPASATDVLAMGTAINLLVGREVAQRLYETQGSTRRSEDNPPGAAAQSFTPIIRQYQARLQAEKRSLARRWGAM